MTAAFDTLINSLAGGPAPKAMVDPKTDKKLDESAKQFESVFLAEMLAPMFNTVEVDPMFGGGQAEQIYRSLMVQQYANRIADNGGMGLASHIKAQLLKAQEQGSSIR